MKIEIQIEGMSLYGTCTQEQFEQDVFNLELSDYTLEVTNGEQDSNITNAVDGWGNNCQFKFRNAHVIYTP